MAPVPPPALVDKVLAVRRGLLRAADSLLPPWAVMWDKAMGIERTQVIGALAELGVADALDGQRLTAEELAPRVGANADALHRVLRAAAVDGIVRMDRRGRFRLTGLGKTLKSDAPASLRSWARYMNLASTRDAWGDLTESVRTGRSAFPRVHGKSVWTWFAEHPEEERLFAEAMRSVTEVDAPGLSSAGLWPEEGTVCDVAGGAGTLLAALLAERPGLRGVLVEAKGVLAEAEGFLAGRGLRDRVELREGDLFGELDAEADVYVLKNILHDWDDETSARILDNLRATMRPGSRVVLIEQLQERNEPHPFASLTDLQMLTQCDDGRERSPAELQGMLAAARLEPGRVERAGISSLIEGTAR